MVFDRTTERTAASFGASVGASLGRGPVSAGIGGGFGGALGYVAGSLVSCGAKPVADGGTRAARPASRRSVDDEERRERVSIPVEDASEP